MKTINVLLTVMLTLIIGACSIEKRVHQPGYHLNWKKNLSTTPPNKVSENEGLKTSLKPHTVEVQSEKKHLQLSFKTEEADLSGTSFTDHSEKLETVSSRNTAVELPANCDVIVMKDGEEIEAKVVEVGTSKVRYKHCGDPSGPVFVEHKSDIFMIKHGNGRKTVFGDETNENVNDQEEDDYLSSTTTDDKSLVVALGLWFFLGIIGIHRFYLGHIGIGVLYFLTLGICGLGWLIDGILFATGSLKPKNGRYTDA